MSKNQNKHRRTKLYEENPFCPECGVFMGLPEDVPQSGIKQFQPDNMCTFEHIFGRANGDRKYNKTVNRILCRKCNNEFNKSEEQVLGKEVLWDRSGGYPLEYYFDQPDEWMKNLLII